jgi:hypothetical protein|tara:strand:- start:1209 stop:1397 length:189 start_codon:yes stop_codon:yes gene_type:complete
MLRIRLAKEFGMTPTEAGKRFTAKEVGQILAYEMLERENAEQQMRDNELRNKASQQRSSATG